MSTQKFFSGAFISRAVFFAIFARTSGVCDIDVAAQEITLRRTPTGAGFIVPARSEPARIRGRTLERAQYGVVTERAEAVSHYIAEKEFAAPDQEATGEARTIGEDGEFRRTGVASPSLACTAPKKAGCGNETDVDASFEFGSERRIVFGKIRKRKAAWEIGFSHDVLMKDKILSDADFR